MSPIEVFGAFTSAYGDTGKHTIDIAYLCRIEHGEFELDKGEKSDAAWFRLEDMPRLAFAGERQALAALLERPARSGSRPRRGRAGPARAPRAR